MNTQTKLLEKKIFTSGCGAKYCYTFVPSIATKLYTNYTTKFIEVNSKVTKSNDKLKDADFIKEITADKEKAKVFEQLAQNNLQEMEDVNEMGYNLMLLICSKNEQDREIDKKDIEENMSITDMVNFISYAIIGDPKDQKKNIKK